MVKILEKNYKTYAIAIRELLNVSQNSLYRYKEREKLTQYKLPQLIEYCVENKIARDDILKGYVKPKNFEKSFEEEMIEKFGLENYHKMYVPDENSIDPKNCGSSSHKKVNIHCLCAEQHYIENIEIFKIFNYDFEHGHCPALTHKTDKYVLKEESLGLTYPKSIELWSKKNDISPYEVYPKSSKKVWWICENGYHDDYQRVINSQITILDKRNDNICPECNKLFGYEFENLTGKQFGDLYVLGLNKYETYLHSINHKSKNRTGRLKKWNCKCVCGKIVLRDTNTLKTGKSKNCGDKKKHNSGPNNGNWRGGVTPKNESIRKSPKYKEWTLKVYQKDNFTCQACGVKKSGDNIKLNAHHIISFSYLVNNNDKRLFDINIGITLCENCHYSTKSKSLHNIYGTFDVTKEQLESFINAKRKTVGIKQQFSINDYMKGVTVELNYNTRKRVYKKKKDSITSLCKEHGINRSTVQRRLKQGMNLEEALNTRVRPYKKQCKDHLGNQYSSKSEMCLKYNIPLDTFNYRIKKKWSLEKL